MIFFIMLATSLGANVLFLNYYCLAEEEIKSLSTENERHKEIYETLKEQNHILKNLVTVLDNNLKDKSNANNERFHS